MDDLFDFNLFQTPFVVDNVEYMIFNQWLVQINSGEFVDGITLKGKDADGKFLLFAFDKENRTIVPIPINTLNSILIGLKNIPFPSKLSKYAQLFETLPENNHRISKDCFLKLSDQISALVTSVARNIPNERIECEMIEHLRTTPNMLVISAFDGITTTVYLEIQNESLQLIKPWGILSKISFYKDNNFIGEYYTQKCDVKNNSTMSFLCQPKIVSVLERRKMSGMKISGVNVYELSDFIVSSAGLSNSVHFPPEFTQCQKWYTVIIPVLGLEVSNSFGMGCVEFFVREDQAISRILDFEENFDAYKTFALAHVNSEKMYSAFQIGKQQIEQTLDLLINLLKDDSLFSIHSLGNHLLSRDIDFFERKVELAPWVYIETPFNNAHLSYNFQDTGNPSPLQVFSSFLELIPEIQKAELLLIKATGTNDEEIGLELRQTEQGQLITKLHKEILQNPPELTVEFFKLINHNYVKIHFFSAQHAIDILKGKEFYTSAHFKKAIERFDELSGTIQILPYSKEDRKIIKILRKEYPDTPIDLVHSLICTLSYIKCTIFDAFYGNLLMNMSRANRIPALTQTNGKSESTFALSPRFSISTTCWAYVSPLL